MGSSSRGTASAIDVPICARAENFIAALQISRLRDNPYFSHEGNCYCPDYEFGFGKLESGVMWRILDNLEASQKDRLLSPTLHLFDPTGASN